MLAEKSPVFLLASPEPEMLNKYEPLMLGMGAHVQVVMTAPAALAAIMVAKPPDLVLLDVDLPGMPIERLLAAARASQEGQSFPIVLVTDVMTQTWIDRVAEGMLDDLVPNRAQASWMQFRLSQAIRLHHMKREAEMLRESVVLNAQRDRLTGVFNREAMLAMLFRETDRVQRQNGAMCLVLFDVDDFGHWNSRLGVDACDELLCQIVARTNRLLRSYDLLGRPGMDEFLIALPGCGNANAVMLAERLRLEVFSRETGGARDDTVLWRVNPACGSSGDIFVADFGRRVAGLVGAWDSGRDGDGLVEIRGTHPQCSGSDTHCVQDGATSARNS